MKADPDVWTAVTVGPPTPELIIQKAPGTDPATAAAQAAALLPSWKEKSIAAYGVLLPRIDFHKNVALAQTVARKAGAKQDGHALWNIILGRNISPTKFTKPIRGEAPPPGQEGRWTMADNTCKMARRRRFP